MHLHTKNSSRDMKNYITSFCGIHAFFSLALLFGKIIFFFIEKMCDFRNDFADRERTI